MAVEIKTPGANVFVGAGPSGRPPVTAAAVSGAQPFPRRPSRFWYRVALLKAVAFDAIGLTVLFMLSVYALAFGLAELAPDRFGVKLSSLAGFTGLRGYLFWNKVTVGHIVAAGFFMFMVFVWKRAATDLLVKRSDIDDSHFHADVARKFWRIVAVALLCLDGVLMFVSIMAGFGQQSAFHALLVTLLYLALVAAYTAGSLHLWHNVRRIQC